MENVSSTVIEQCMVPLIQLNKESYLICRGARVHPRRMRIHLRNPENRRVRGSPLVWPAVYEPDDGTVVIPRDHGAGGGVGVVATV